MKNPSQAISRAISLKNIQTIEALSSPRVFYGNAIYSCLKEYFPEEKREAEEPKENPTKQLDQEVISLKVDLLRSRLQNYPALHADAFFKVIIKVRQWLLDKKNQNSIKSRPVSDSFAKEDPQPDSLVVYCTKPNNLLFRFTGVNNVSVLCNWYTESSILHTLLKDEKLPELALPGCIMIVENTMKKIKDITYITAKSVTVSRHDSLSVLIKEMDFVKEYLLLANTAAVPDRTESQEHSKIAEMVEDL
ncbi:hypothetical protein [Spirochaeta dissipatitropha]